MGEGHDNPRSLELSPTPQLRFLSTQISSRQCIGYRDIAIGHRSTLPQLRSRRQLRGRCQTPVQFLKQVSAFADVSLTTLNDQAKYLENRAEVRKEPNWYIGSSRCARSQYGNRCKCSVPCCPTQLRHWPFVHNDKRTYKVGNTSRINPGPVAV